MFYPQQPKNKNGRKKISRTKRTIEWYLHFILSILNCIALLLYGQEHVINWSACKYFGLQNTRKHSTECKA